MEQVLNAELKCLSATVVILPSEFAQAAVKAFARLPFRNLAIS